MASPDRRGSALPRPAVDHADRQVAVHQVAEQSEQLRARLLDDLRVEREVEVLLRPAPHQAVVGEYAEPALAGGHVRPRSLDPPALEGRDRSAWPRDRGRPLWAGG